MDKTLIYYTLLCIPITNQFFLYNKYIKNTSAYLDCEKKLCYKAYF
jgi:hypothetical protein